MPAPRSRIKGSLKGAGGLRTFRGQSYILRVLCSFARIGRFICILGFMAQPADILFHMLGKRIFSGACKELLIPCEASNGLRF